MKRIIFMILISSVISFLQCSSQLSTHKKENEDGITRIARPLILNISFYPNSDSFMNNSYNVLDKIYNSMKKYSEDKFIIAGHIQKIGNKETSQPVVYLCEHFFYRVSKHILVNYAKQESV